MKLVDSFAGEAPQFDDITMLSFTYRGSRRPGAHCRLNTRVSPVTSIEMVPSVSL